MAEGEIAKAFSNLVESASYETVPAPPSMASLVCLIRFTFLSQAIQKKLMELI